MAKRSCNGGYNQRKPMKDPGPFSKAPQKKRINYSGKTVASSKKGK